MKSFEFFKLTLAIVLAWLLSVGSAQAGYIVTLQQVGPNVVATGSGAINLTGLTVFQSTSLNPGMKKSSGGAMGFALINTGPSSSGVDSYSGGTGPTTFGGPFISLFRPASSGSGDMVGIAAGFLGVIISVPTGYVSGSALSDTATYSGTTLGLLGVTPGTYVWSWGTGANQNFTLQIVFVSSPPTPTPTPTASPLPRAVSQIDGSGTIAAPRGRRDAQFSIFDVENEQFGNSQFLEGQFGYVDKRSHIRLTSGNIQTVTINGNQAAFTGISHIRGRRSKQMVQFTVTVRANEAAVPDTFSIVLDNGYSASGKLTSGSIRISAVDPDPD